MIKCIAIDDEPKALEIISLFSERVEFISLEKVFVDPFKALSYLTDNEVDLILLDINMPDISGINFIKNLNKEIFVIFTTAHSEYAMESYEVNAIDYLLKPFEFARFFLALSKVKDKLNSNKNKKDDFFFLNTGAEKHRLSYNDIFYIETDGNYMRYHTKKGRYLVRASVKETNNLLPNKQFIQIHRSYIVSIKAIEKIEDNHVFINKNSLPVSASYRDHFYSIIDLSN